MDEARETNSNIVSEEDQEENEEIVNAIYLKILEYGADSLTTEDSTNMAILASLCPYIGGTAVYKARALYAMYEPSLLYDDIYICNVIGVYKNSNNNNATVGLFNKENEYLASLNPKEVIQQKSNKFVLFPNPASTTITIAYELQQNEKGKLIVFDMLGREHMEVDLNCMNNRVSVSISGIPQGIYTYKYLVNNIQRETGKLLIQK